MLALGLIVVCAAMSGAPASPRPVSFSRDIRPIMSDTCFRCHGPDAKSREAGMRLDIREEALKPTKNELIPIVPGKPEESEIILRINDPVEPMPPEDAHKALTPEQKELFRRWVAEGAVYEPHWAYAPLVRPKVPGSPGENAIDAFIRAPLAEKGIAPSPEAPKHRLLRRLSLDLTGLPPTPEETAAYLADRSAGAYERQVERLLMSPRHGERMAVWWLDVARFTDTVGFHGDQIQRIFPYRDYVINSFNTNKRFDQFTLEQLAGDLLPGATDEQRVATGYNRLNMMTREGGAQPGEYLAKYGAERVRSVSAAWFGSTFGCAECHDHKFDPIKASDFYQLQAFFADVKQWGVYSDYEYTPNPDLAGFKNDHPFPPEIEVPSPYLSQRKMRLEAERAALFADIRAAVQQPDLAREFEAWVERGRAFIAQEPSGWSRAAVSAAVVMKGRAASASTVAINPGGEVALPQEMRTGESLQITVQPGAGSVAALQIDFAAAPAPAREVDIRSPLAVVRLSAAVRGRAGGDRQIDFIFADSRSKEARYDHGAEVIGIQSGWKLPRDANERLVGVWLLASPVTLADGETIVLTLTGSQLPPFLVSTSPFAAPDAISSSSDELRRALAVPRERRSTAQKELLAEAWLLSTARDSGAFARRHELAARIRETRGGRAWTMVTQAAEPRTVRVLPRGNWQDESGPVVLPATPSFLPGRLTSSPERRLTRLDLARWIVSEDNPITARTVVNRLWAMFFGTGLSAVLDDLGSQGEAPSHPELLDWLASEFRQSGWDLRHITRLIVTSATYRQESGQRPEVRDVDPANRLIASQNPRRLEAEFVRDNALFIAGVLNVREVGGPSVRPYQPAGYYSQLQFPDREYEPSTDDEQWRRGVYMHWQRTFLHPMLATFDAPARDECLAQRSVSNTPQQALTLLNDPTFVEAARLLAARVHREVAGDDGRLRHSYLLAVSREPRPAELESLHRFLAAQRAHYRTNIAEADKLLAVGLAPRTEGDVAELAVWTQVARVLLNSHEVVTRY